MALGDILKKLFGAKPKPEQPMEQQPAAGMNDQTEQMNQGERNDMEQEQLRQ